jgi:hypothetical protein
MVSDSSIIKCSFCGKRENEAGNTEPSRRMAHPPCLRACLLPTGTRHIRFKSESGDTIVSRFCSTVVQGHDGRSTDIPPSSGGRYSMAPGERGDVS